MGGAGDAFPLPGFAGLAERDGPAGDGRERLDVLRASAGMGEGLEKAGGSGVCVIWISAPNRRDSSFIVHVPLLGAALPLPG